MKEESNIEDKINGYLSNKEKSLDASFTDDVLNQISAMDKSPIISKKKISFFPIALFGFVTCVLSLFILKYPEPNRLDNAKLNENSNDLAPTLEGPVQVMLEDLMSIPEEFDSSEILFSEETYDLLVLLDY
jgi:hypothetical protein